MQVTSFQDTQLPAQPENLPTLHLVASFVAITLNDT